MLDSSDPSDDRLLTLKEACDTFFRGAIKPSTLRAEHKRGKLVIIQIGRTQFVTRGGIRNMIEKCQSDLSERAHASGSGRVPGRG